MIFQWLVDRRRKQEILRQRDQWESYCNDWHREYDIKFMFSFAEVKRILEDDIRSTRHWTA